MSQEELCVSPVFKLEDPSTSDTHTLGTTVLPGLRGNLALLSATCQLLITLESRPPVLLFSYFSKISALKSLMDTPPILPPTPEPPAPSDAELKQWTVITHVCPLIGLVVPFAGNIVAPLIVWLIKKPELPGLEPVGKTVLNFQISWSIWMIIASAIGVAASCLIVPLLLPLGFVVAWIVFTIIGSIKASNGEPYEYPLTLKILQ